jgi:hypothetical protein
MQPVQNAKTGARKGPSDAKIMLSDKTLEQKKTNQSAFHSQSG